MSETEDVTADEQVSTYREYPLGVQIVEVLSPDADGTSYRFEAPEHVGKRFATADDAELYTDVYFDTNGFQEAGTGDRGVPPEVIQAGRDTLAAYFRTQPYATVDWVASFYGKKPPKIERYLDAVRMRAEEIRDGIRERNL